MSTYTFFINTLSGAIATLDESMDVESWIKDGKLKELSLNSNDECFLTNRVFPGWWGDASEGQAYNAEWACPAQAGHLEWW